MSLFVEPVCSNRTQLLWVNLIMDTMGALALATEDPNPDLLNDRVRHQHSIVGSARKASLSMLLFCVAGAHLVISSWSACWLRLPTCPVMFRAVSFCVVL